MKYMEIVRVGSINRKWTSDKPEKGRHGTTHRVKAVYKI